MPANLVRLKLHELSLVDNPANKSAKVTIFKHLDDQGSKLNTTQENDMTEAEMTKKLEEAATKQAATEALLKAALAEKELLRKKADMTVEEKTFVKAENMTPEEESAFMEEEEEKRKKKMAAFVSKRQSDESITVEGVVIKKSDVGDASFHVMKSQQEALQKAKDDNEIIRLEKRVNDEFPLVAGTVADKAAVLKALATAPQNVRTAAEAIFKSANEMAGSAFTSLGIKPRLSANKGADSFSVKVAEIMKRDNVSRLQAMEKAREEAPEAFQALQEEAA